MRFAKNPFGRERSRPIYAAAVMLILAGQASAIGDEVLPSPERALPSKVKSEEVPTELNLDTLGEDTSTDKTKTGNGIDDLTLFSDIPVVISAGRREQKINATSIPVSIITSADIRYGGRTNIADALRYVPGMDVLQFDRNRYGVGVRGMHHEYADRTLVLINGRNAGDVAYGTTDWSAMPLLMDDIDRIEVVRGPGGAVWGANAFNGVINILTSKPEELHGFTTSSTLTEFGDSYSQFRWAAGTKNFSWKISAGYDDVDSSQDALNGETFVANDFRRGTKIDTEGVYGVDSDTKLRFGFAQSHQARGPYEVVGYLPDRNGRYDAERMFARLEHTFSSTATGHLQWYTNLAAYENPAVSRFSTGEHDLEAQLNFMAGEDHQLTVGGNARLTTFDQTQRDPQQIAFSGAPSSEGWGGVFVTDRWQLTRSFAIDAQLRGDTYSGTGNDWSGRLTGMYSLDAKAHHTLRLGAAKAFRAPETGIRNFTSTYPPPVGSPPFITGLVSVGNQNAHNEQIYSLEAGYTGNLGGGWVARADAYYQLLQNVAGFAPSTVVPPLIVVQYDNIDGAHAFGLETELAYQQERNKASLYFAWNGFETDQPNQDTRSYYPSKFKFGATGRTGIGEHWTLSANYAFTGLTHRETDDGRLPMTHSLDISVARTLGAHAELQVGINDVMDRTGKAFLPLGALTSHDAPGRTLYATLRIAF